VEFTAALAAYLAALSETFDDPDTDIAETMRRLGADTKVAVNSYLGLSVMIADGGQHINLTALDDLVEPGDIRTSLMLPLGADGADGAASTGTQPVLALILYAGTPGTFVDLAADLASLAGRALTELLLDEHLVLPEDASASGGLGDISIIDQAIGVLIARGFTPEHAHRELSDHADLAQVDHHTAATGILASLGTPLPDAV
jgi:hypothetical protein